MTRFTIKTHHIAVFAIALLATVQLSCTQKNETLNEEAARKQAVTFAEAFYNFDYQKAKQSCAKGATTWIDMLISNIKKEDIAAINKLKSTATVKVLNEENNDRKVSNDSSIIVRIQVKDAFVMDTIGKPGHLVSEMNVRIPLIAQKGVWKVKMEDLPQNEK